LRTKFNTLREACTNSDEVDIYLFTETWLNDSHFDGELGLKNYTVFRKDRLSPVFTEGEEES